MPLAVTESDVQQLLSELAFIRSYGFRLLSIADGVCSLEVPFQEAFERPGGLVSGPVFMAAADVAMWLAIMTKLGKEEVVSPAGEVQYGFLTAEMKTAFLNAAKRESFHCTARILKMGKRLIYGVVECVNDEGKLLTHHTILCIRPDSYQ